MRDIVITSSILILAILLIRHLAKGRINPLLQYALWLLVVFRLAIPVSFFQSPVSVLNLFPDLWTTQKIQEEQDFFADKSDKESSVKMQSGDEQSVNGQSVNGQQEADEWQAVNGQEPADGRQAVDEQQSADDQQIIDVQTVDAQTVSGRNDTLIWRLMRGYNVMQRYLPFIWCAGIFLTGGYMLFYQMKWKKYLLTYRKPFKKQSIYREKLSVYTVKGLPSPCLTGRCIYLTKEMAADEKQLSHILAHEYCHYKHGDSLWVIVRCVLTAIYWFHPLVWAAAYVSKQDSEFACDEAAIKLLGEKERYAYGKTLLKLISSEPYDRSRIGIASTMSGGEKGIKERIRRIAGKPKYLAVTAGIVVVAAVSVIIMTFSGAGKKADISYQDEKRTDSEQTASVQQEEMDRLNQMEKELQEKQEILHQEEEQLMAAYEEQQYMDMQDNQEKAAYYQILVDYYDEMLSSGKADIKNPADYVQSYDEKGEEALDEGLYLLEHWQGIDEGDEISIYGMYTKGYGCNGIKIQIGDDVNNYEEPWTIAGLHGREENLRVYGMEESSGDGSIRSFAWKTPLINTGSSEIWSFFLCDRYDTGTIELYHFAPEVYIEQIQERISFEVVQSEQKVYVYDSGELAGAVDFSVLGDYSADGSALKKVEEVVWDGSSLSWELGYHENEIRLLTAIGLKLETGQIWYRGLNLISFPVECGSFGERSFQLGKAEVETDYVCGKIQTLEETSDTENSLKNAFQREGGHHEVELIYTNPCPSYTRISDVFGTRVHPVTGEEWLHNGVDLAAEEGADIVAAAEGVVYQTGYDSINGNYVVLYHSLNGAFTYYTGCKEILVKEGDGVARGEKIAKVGKTGQSTGAHLHFAVSMDGEYVEPVFEE